MKQLSIIVFLLTWTYVGFAQSGTSKKEKKVISIQKTIDKDGNEVIEKKVLEGDAAKKDLDWEEKGGQYIKITTDSTNGEKKIIINEEINISDDQGRAFISGSSGRGYTERTVTIKKNADGSVEIKDKSGDPLFYNMKVDSTQSKKPTLGVSLDEDMRITSLLEGSAAATAGLIRNDVITHVDGVFIEDYDHLKELLSKKQVGDKINLTYLRDRKELKTVVTLKGGTTRISFNR